VTVDRYNESDVGERKMKLLIVTPYFYPKMGGVEKYVFEISSHLKCIQNLDIVIICSNWEKGGNRYQEETINNVKVYRLPYWIKISSTPINPLWGTAIATIIDNEKPDVINGHTPVPYIADIAARVAKNKRIPFILTYHNDLEGYNLIFKAFAAIYSRSMGARTLTISHKVIATSQHYVKTSNALSKITDKIAIVPPGVDVEKYKRNPSNILQEKYNIQYEKTVLFVGQLNRESIHKGLYYLFKAIKKANEKMPIKLIVAGKGNHLTQYREYVNKEKINNSVVFTGYVSEDDLIKLYNACDILVLPSYNRAEGFGMVLLEAQACGTPVIGSNVGGIPCAIRDGETGLLVPPKDIQKLSQAITTLLGDDVLMRKMGLEGMKHVRDEFTWEKSAQTYYCILNETIR
jgi:glycosyltransferase involved in cell wall biosynthesis